MQQRIRRSWGATRVFCGSVGWATAICFGASAAIADADPRVAAGEALYHQYCGACHGISADGQGAISSMLSPKPTDLRRIAARRHGTFPEIEIQRIIDGRDPVVAHGRREMPVWGHRFGEAREPGVEKESAVRGDTLLLVTFLKSIQIAN